MAGLRAHRLPQLLLPLLLSQSAEGWLAPPPRPLTQGGCLHARSVAAVMMGKVSTNRRVYSSDDKVLLIDGNNLMMSRKVIAKAGDGATTRYVLKQ